MKIKRARYTYAHDRQARKPRRRLLFAGLFSVILLLFCGNGVASFVKDTSMPSAEAVAYKKYKRLTHNLSLLLLGLLIVDMF